MSYPEQPESVTEVDFVALDVVKRVIQSWWLVALLVVLGGLIGLVAARLVPVEYEGGFSVITGVDQVNTGALTQYAQDVMLDAVGAILESPTTIEKVASAARAQGIQIDANELKNSHTMERHISTWQVWIRRPNQSEVDALANLWAGIGAADLQEAYIHAQNADGLKRYLSNLENCLSHAVTSEPALGTCNPDTLVGIQNEMDHTGVALNEELSAARGLSSGVLINLMEKNLTSARVVQNQSSQFVFAGGLVGLIVAIWLVQTNIGASLARFVRRLGRG